MTTFEETVLKELATIKTMLGTRPAATSGDAGGIASDYEMEGQYGDPVIKKDPPKWTGETCVGKPFSQCPPDYLMSLAGFLDWKAGKTLEDADTSRHKFADYDRKDARRARGWAARLRAKPAAAVPEYDGNTNGEPLPF